MKKIVLIAFVSLLAACGNSTVEKPAKLIAEDTMVDIFYDLALLEALKAHNPTYVANSKEPNKYIYKKYGIDSLQFAQNNRYYASDIKRYKKMYGRVGKRLDRQKKELDSLDEKGQKTATPKIENEGVIK